MTTRASWSLRAALTASAWPGRKSSKPKTSLSVLRGLDPPTRPTIPPPPGGPGRPAWFPAFCALGRALGPTAGRPGWRRRAGLHVRERELVLQRVLALSGLAAGQRALAAEAGAAG